jgi:hypothetical protein
LFFYFKKEKKKLSQNGIKMTTLCLPLSVNA